MVSNKETYILISENGLFPAEYIYPSDDLFPDDPGLRQISNIVSGTLKLNELICERVPQFGQMFASKFECKVYLEEDLSGKFIHVYQVIDGVSKDVFAGKIDSCKLDNIGTDRTIVAYDLAYEKGKQNIAGWWENFWVGKSSATLKQVRESLLTSVGIAFEQVTLPNDDLEITKTVSLTSCTMTAMLRMICELNYCFPHLDRTGYMVFIMLNTEPEEIKNITGQFEGANSKFEDFITSDIDGVQFYDSGSELKYTYGESTNAYPVKQNIFLYDQPTSVLNSIASQMLDYLADFKYTPATVKMILSDIDLQLGDFVHTNKGDFYVLENTYSGSQLYEQTIKAQGQELLYGATPNFDYSELVLNEKIARVRQTVEAFQVEYADFKENTRASFEVTSESISTEVTRAQSAEGDLSSRITQTADSLSSEITRAKDAENSLSSRITQTAESISLEVTNGSTSSTIKLKLGNTELSSKTIQMTGLVTFSNLSTLGQTTINGSNIKTGTIDASQVSVTNINADNITTGSISADKIQGGQLIISPDSNRTKAIIVKYNNTNYITINQSNGIELNGYGGNSLSLSGQNGLRIGWGSFSGIQISGTTGGGNITVGSNSSDRTTISNGSLTCKSLNVNNAAYSGKSVYGFNGSYSLNEIKSFDIDSSTALWAVERSSAPSMHSDGNGGYSFSNSVSWKQIKLKSSSYSTKIYGISNGYSTPSLATKTVLSQ